MFLFFCLFVSKTICIIIIIASLMWTMEVNTNRTIFWKNLGGNSTWNNKNEGDVLPSISRDNYAPYIQKRKWDTAFYSLPLSQASY